MSDFGELVLVCGDFNIPSRESHIPQEIAERIVPGKMHHVVCTGNIITKSMEDFLRTLAPSVHIVRGDHDSVETFPDLPEHKVIKIGEFRIGVTHGHQIVPWGNADALANLQRQLDVDVLVYGSPDHSNGLVEYEGRHLLTPGSITGSYSVANTASHPSFILLALKGTNAVAYFYQLVDGELILNKSEFSKKD